MGGLTCQLLLVPEQIHRYTDADVWRSPVKILCLTGWQSRIPRLLIVETSACPKKCGADLQRRDGFDSDCSSNIKWQMDQATSIESDLLSRQIHQANQCLESSNPWVMDRPQALVASLGLAALTFMATWRFRMVKRCAVWWTFRMVRHDFTPKIIASVVVVFVLDLFSCPELIIAQATNDRNRIVCLSLGLIMVKQ